jgi:hypothetical protein
VNEPDLWDVVAQWDWITPIWAFIQDFLNGPVVDFGINPYGGWSKWNIRQLLKRNGIKSWGYLLNISVDTLMFTIRKQDAWFAYHQMTSAGVPVLYAPVGVRDETTFNDIYI